MVAVLNVGCTLAACTALAQRGERPWQLQAAKALLIGPLALLEVRDRESRE